MRALYVLVALNALVWSFALSLNSAPGHFTLIGSYPFWWYDDFPWAALTIAVIVPLFGIATKAWRSTGPRRVMKTTGAILLCAFLPWACMSGGGV